MKKGFTIFDLKGQDFRNALKALEGNSGQQATDTEIPPDEWEKIKKKGERAKARFCWA